jgi:hypothetical protein
MARLAELSGFCYRNVLALLILVGMTVNALLEAVLFGTDAVVHRFITLVHEKLHVILTHDLSRFDALVALATVDLQFRTDISCTKRPTHKE